MSAQRLRIDRGLSIDPAELDFTATTSSGPGGQHVNRSQTRVVLRFDVGRSPSLDDAQRARILERLPTRISREGILRVSCQVHRSQGRNRDTAVERFVALLREALHEDPSRRPTRPTSASRKRRHEEKRRRGETKRMRSKPGRED